MKNRLLFFLTALWTLTVGLSNAQEPSVTHGTVIYYDSFPSEFVPDRPLAIWIPPNYTSSKKFPVIVMYDGQMLFDANTTWNNQEWGVDEVLGQAIIDRKLPPAIVVAVWNIPDIRYREYYPRKPFDALPEFWADSIIAMRMGAAPTSDDYLKYVVEEVLPFVHAKHSTDPNRVYVMGSSMGGLMSMYALCEYPEVFSAAACVSTHFVGVFQYTPEVTTTFADYMTENMPEPRTHRIYMDYGDQTLDAQYAPAQAMIDERMRQLGWRNPREWTTEFFPGAAHDEKSWNARLMTPLTFLLKPPKK